MGQPLIIWVICKKAVHQKATKLTIKVSREVDFSKMQLIWQLKRRFQLLFCVL